MKIFSSLSLFVLIGTCATKKYSTKIENIKDSIQLVDSTSMIKYANTITTKELSKHLYTYASDDFEGRKTGEPGQKKAVEFLRAYYINEGIKSAYGTDNYFQTIPADFFLKANIKSSENVLAFIKGSEKPDEIIIVSAHLDHIGVTNDGYINYGADDDGSGTVALMEMAQAFTLAKKDGYGPKRSILFLHLTAEEIGKRGSEFYVKNPVFPLKNTIVNLNIDMIGRVDDIHKKNKNYLYLIGSDRLSKELHYISEKVNNAYFNLSST